MSGFFGIFRPQGGSVNLDAFEQMRKATELEGFDGLATHVEEKIAMGHLMLRVSPEAKYDQQPLHSECGRYLLVGHFRLDYRDELGDKLGLTQSELELTPDSRLVMLAYQKWKDQCVHHIEGDWAFVLFDRSSNSLMLAKDRTGYSALFYTVYQGAIYFSSDVNVIGAIESIPFEVDMVQFYRLSLSSLLVQKGRTLLKEVYHLNGGTYIDYRNDSQLRISQYWQKITTDSIRYRDDQDYAEQLKSIFSNAVRCRLRTNGGIGIFLSSGRDSMAVAYFSSAELKSKNKKLYSYTSYPFHLDKIDVNYHKYVNEMPLVQKFISNIDNIEPKFMNFPHVTMQDYFNSNLTKDSYFPLISTNTFWIQGILQDAKKMNLKRLLNGQVGNMTITFNAPFIQADNFFSFRVNELIKEFKSLRKLKSISSFILFKSYFLQPIYMVVKSYFNSKKIFRSRHLSTSIFIKLSGLKTSDFKKSQLYDEYVAPYYFFKSTKKFQLDQMDRLIDFAGMRWYKDSHDVGIESIDPTSDERLVDFILSLNSKEFNKNGVSKFIYRNLMKFALDESILSNQHNMSQSYDFVYRLASENSFSDFLKFIDDESLNYFQNEFVQLAKSYNLLASDPFRSSNNRDIQVVLKNTSLLCWLLKNKKFKFGVN